ncbi:MAG: hypothetical protein R3D98_14895 [Candidatus Krumholzibacteriia bacterium]
MSSRDGLGRACLELGLAYELRLDRVQPRFRLTLDTVDGRQILQLTLRDEHDVTPWVLDVDRERQGVLFEMTVKTVKREPSFDLWLEEVERERYLVVRREGRWRLIRAEGVGTVEKGIDLPG